MHAKFTWKWQLVDVALAVNLFYKIIAQIHNLYVYFGAIVQEQTLQKVIKLDVCANRSEELSS